MVAKFSAGYCDVSCCGCGGGWQAISCARCGLAERWGLRVAARPQWWLLHGVVERAMCLGHVHVLMQAAPLTVTGCGVALHPPSPCALLPVCPAVREEAILAGHGCNRVPTS